MNQDIFIYNASLLCKAKNSYGEWVVGYYTPELSTTTYRLVAKIRFQREIEKDCFTSVEACTIDPNTLCRCIGIQDINSQFIFDGDYVKHYTRGKKHKDTFDVGKVFFDRTTLSWKRTVEFEQENGQQVITSRSLPNTQIPSAQMSALRDYEVIGNWRDNVLEEVLNSVRSEQNES